MAVLSLSLRFSSFFKDEKGRWATWIVSEAAAAAAATVVVVGTETHNYNELCASLWWKGGMCARDKDALKVAQACTNALLAVVLADDDDETMATNDSFIWIWTRERARRRRNPIKSASYTHSLSNV